MKRRRFSKEFKLQVLQELQSGKTAAQVCRSHDLKEMLVSKWKREYERDPLHAFSGNGNPSTQETKEAELERKVGQQAMEIDFLKRVNTNLQARLAELKKTR